MKEDFIVEKLLEHDIRLQRIEETMVTKTEFYEFKDQMLQTQDDILGILRRIDTERFATRAGMERMQGEIDMIKVKLEMA